MQHGKRRSVADTVARVTRWWRRDELHEGPLPAWQSAHATQHTPRTGSGPAWVMASSSTSATAYKDVDDWAAQGVRGFKAKGISPQHLKALIERTHARPHRHRPLRLKFADLFIVRDNSLVDIRNTRHVRTVVNAGVVYDPADQLRSVEGKIGPKEN
jgi:hypothetical protein